MKTQHTNKPRLSYTATLLLLGLTLFLHGCGTKRPVPPPFPDAPGSIPTPAPTSVVRPPSAVYTPELGPAESLYHAAKKSLGSGDTHKAELTMERALRIEPKNGHYWYTMAQIKFRQRQYDQAIQLCLKSKSMAGKNEQLLALNDGLIAKAKRKMN